MKKRLLVLAMALLVALCACAQAEGSISTTVSMRVSRLIQDAIVDAGEDLTIEIDVSGVEPTAYQWYFNDQAIEGANQRVYNMVNVTVEDAGVYRMDAFDEDGRMLVSMDVSVRVVEPEVPKSGDPSRPVAAALIGLASLGALTAMSLRRRKA